MERRSAFATLGVALLTATVGLTAAGGAALGAAPRGGDARPPRGAPAPCGGTLVISITQRIVNDTSTGSAGDPWALERLGRRLRVWRTADDTYCALVSSRGRFTTIEGTSPGGDGSVPPGIVGAVAGGYQATVRGTLLVAPLWPADGDLGVVDYGCDAVGACPGYVSWTDAYFEADADFAYEWWSWRYETRSNGTWVDASDGDAGDITG